MHKHHPLLRMSLLVLACTGLGGCASMGYYLQSVSGQMQILHRERPLRSVIADPATGPALRERLGLIREVVDFAHERLHLPDNGSYRDYADLDRPYVTWNVFAAPALSLQPRQWCYLVVGCLAYRGYFSRDRAFRYGEKLRRQGWDVFVGGVRAYSTLGWFRDPVLNTMLDQEDWEIARLLFHELAHQKLYFDGETDVDEAFAETVARIGLARWLRDRPPDLRRRVQRLLAHEDALMGLLLDYRSRIQRLYHSDLAARAKRTGKARLFARLRADYRRQRGTWGDDHRFDAWIDHDLNNAKLAAISTYYRLIPAFLALYRAGGRDLGRFYRYMKGLKGCNHATLLRRIRFYSPGEGC